MLLCQREQASEAATPIETCLLTDFDEWFCRCGRELNIETLIDRIGAGHQVVKDKE